MTPPNGRSESRNSRRLASTASISLLRVFASSSHTDVVHMQDGRGVQLPGHSADRAVVSFGLTVARAAHSSLGRPVPSPLPRRAVRRAVARCRRCSDDRPTARSLDLVARLLVGRPWAAVVACAIARSPTRPPRLYGMPRSSKNHTRDSTIRRKHVDRQAGNHVRIRRKERGRAEGEGRGVHSFHV